MTVNDTYHQHNTVGHQSIPVSERGESSQSRHLEGRGGITTRRPRDLPPNSGKTKTNRLKTERKAKLKRRQFKFITILY